MATLSQLVPKLSRDMMNVATDAYIELCETVHDDTPVDTHLLEESWVASVNSYANGTVGDGWLTAASRAKLGDSLHAINRQPYVRRIEYTGHSPQAPDGMMWKNIANWPAIVARQL